MVQAVNSKKKAQIASRGGQLLPRLGCVSMLALALAVASALRPARAEAAPDSVPSHRLHVDVDPVQRTLVEVPLGPVQLVREDGVSVSLNELLNADRPVYVDFIYTTCTALCPIMSGTFASLQDKLGSARDRVSLISISIDPEEDTPRRMREFRRKYDAGDEWHFYTGTLEQSIAAQRAFGVYTGDKMLHQPVMLFRAGPKARWVRLDGFATPDDLLRELPLEQAAGR